MMPTKENSLEENVLPFETDYLPDFVLKKAVVELNETSENKVQMLESLKELASGIVSTTYQRPLLNFETSCTLEESTTGFLKVFRRSISSPRNRLNSLVYFLTEILMGVPWSYSN
ncbi:hypothetical protein HNY73_015049 [Argiope bruennichi]|uniref:Uncharacterized protein n=1 Tax=Argiope bruennichi TaxID=94029 RepID=A0A8T0ERF1_ARGBR|nr:hypothetical protein HNY73_015049 [Argiope bruennichi]